MSHDATDHTDNPYRAPASDVAGGAEGAIGTKEALASRGQRLGAYLIDAMLFVVPGVGVVLFGATSGALRTGNVPVVLAGLIITGLALTNLVLLGTRGQTLGKYTLGIKIVRASSHEEASGVRIILGRELSRSVMSGLPMVGFLGMVADSLAIFQDSQQCLHDMIADTNVIRTDSTGGDQWDREWEQNKRQSSGQDDAPSPFANASSSNSTAGSTDTSGATDATDSSRPDAGRSSNRTQPSDNDANDVDNDDGDVHW
jgi:uncharacterized RDD family membrane protein YckC